jgi:hypothetical protein
VVLRLHEQVGFELQRQPLDPQHPDAAYQAA